MSGHNKWSKIKHKKGNEDAKKSQLFSKLSKLIIAESKKCSGDTKSPALATAIETAKKENMPKETIERAIKKGTDIDTATMESVLYETYGPGGSAIVIEVLTDNKNRSAAEIRHVLSKGGYELATQGAALWAFKKDGNNLVANTTINLDEGERDKLEILIDSLEENEDVQAVFTNVN